MVFYIWGLSWIVGVIYGLVLYKPYSGYILFNPYIYICGYIFVDYKPYSNIPHLFLLVRFTQGI